MHSHGGKELAFQWASFPIEFAFPTQLDDEHLVSAKKGIRREQRETTRWKRLHCQRVSTKDLGNGSKVYILEVGHQIEFDWTWEGAIAFKPVSIQSEETEPDYNPDYNREEVDVDESLLWSGEILEVDEAGGRIYVTSNSVAVPPTIGAFFVKPFDFLANIYAIYHVPSLAPLRKLLPQRLAASLGGIHPKIDSPKNVGLPALSEWWANAWSILWGPPGTGKTYTAGQQIAHALADPTERILVVSTTNKATDAIAISIGSAAKQVAANELKSSQILRIGKGTSVSRMRSADLSEMLVGTESDYMEQIEELRGAIQAETNPENRAVLRSELQFLRDSMRDTSRRNFVDANVRAVTATSYQALSCLRSESIANQIASGSAPFTTIFIDEAGLISRATIAALSLLASKRVVLVGDPKQLAPISKISRILPRNQMQWLGQSALNHLQSMQEIPTAEAAVLVLKQQRRMHQEICRVVSAFQYDSMLSTAPEVDSRDNSLPRIFRDQPRALWYVLDEESVDTPSIRATKDRESRSWSRKASFSVFEKLLESTDMQNANGLFVTPFRGQAARVNTFLAQRKLSSWTASTVHSQQGAEADIVFFDTVNAGSYGWPFEEWKRLVNVGLSRAKKLVVLLASRAEMEEPYLRGLVPFLSPQVLRRTGRSYKWSVVSPFASPFQPSLPPKRLQPQSPSQSSTYGSNEDWTSRTGGGLCAIGEDHPQANPIESVSRRAIGMAESKERHGSVQDDVSLGYQIDQRKNLRPIMSREQERLCQLELDGKPRLVRGVAGSGKTIVMAHWLAKTVKRLGTSPDSKVWCLFANRALQTLIVDSIENAWLQETGTPFFPWDRVVVRHLREVLEELLPEAGLQLTTYGFDYDAASAAFLEATEADGIESRCEALFLDEAQDVGPNSLRLLSSLVRQTGEDPNSRSIYFFYDNAQNIYDRATPVWSEFGLDMRGRSTVLKESYRSTLPISEFAINVLYRLRPPVDDADYKELISRGLLRKSIRRGKPWWSVKFNSIGGPSPTFTQFDSLEDEMHAIADRCCTLITKESVLPSDICVVCIGPTIREGLETFLVPALDRIGVRFSLQTNKLFERDSKTLLGTTPHSFKGYDSEIVIVPGVERFFSQNKGILEKNLYVAMTRARSLLMLFGERLPDPASQKIYDAIRHCLHGLRETGNFDEEDPASWSNRSLRMIQQELGDEYHDWVQELAAQYDLRREPVLGSSGELIAQPLFWFKSHFSTYACFGKDPISKSLGKKLESLQVQVLYPSDPIGLIL